MGFIRRLATAATVLGLAAASIAGTTGAASAETTGPVSPTTPGAHSYGFSIATESATQSTGTLQWDNTTWALTLTTSTGQLAAGSCVTVYFDWRSKGHHDARAIRDCASGTTYSASFPDANPGNLLGGPSRMGICYGAEDALGTCSYYSIVSTYYIQMDWTPWPQPTWANPCVLSWSRRGADGTTSSFIDAHPQRRALQGTTC